MSHSDSQVHTERLDFEPGDLICPACGAELGGGGDELSCAPCAIAYGRGDGGPIDLRLRSPKRVTLDIEIGPQRRIDAFDRSLAEPNPAPSKAARLPLDNPRWTEASRFPPAFVTHFPDPPCRGARLLDIGCGDAVFEDFVTRAGYRYTGVDYSDPKAPLWADSRALPFRGELFDAAMMIGALEHVEQPILAVREAHRVLRPGGTLLGDVAFGEPYHDNSFFHHTILGVQSVVESAGFRLDHLGAHPRWHALKAQTEMVMLHGIPSPLIRLLYTPVWATHRAWWWGAHRLRKDDKTSEFHRRHRTAGAFSFVATKT